MSIGRNIIEINPPVSEKHKGLYRLSIKEKTGAIYPMDVTSEGLKVIQLENSILKMFRGIGTPILEEAIKKLLEEYKEAILEEAILDQE